MDMRNYSLILVFAYLFFMISCTKDKDNVIIPEVPPTDIDSTDTTATIDTVTFTKVDLGTFYLNQTSLYCLPYYGKKAVTFINESGEKVKFSIDENDLDIAKNLIYKFNVKTTGDTVLYEYRRQTKSFNIINDSLDTYFFLSLGVQVYINDPESKFISDQLNIYSRDSEKDKNIYWLFNKTINQRTAPDYYDYNIKYPEITFLGRTFTKVEKSEISNQIRPPVYYNYTEGIVAFTDHENKLWRFDSME